jgi:hypothetical protein
LERTAEFDAFGPWILPVTTADEVPRAFRGYAFDFNSSTTIFKVPRDIVRRDANPTMHLYDRVVIVTDDAFTVLERDGDGFTSTSLPIDTIAIIDFGSELLDGWLTVASTDGRRVEVPFNGTSRTTIEPIVDRLVSGSAGAPSRGAGSDSLDLKALGLPDTGLVNLYRASSARRDLRIVAKHAGRKPRARISLIDRVRGLIPRLSGLVLAESDTELVLLSRREWVRRSSKPDLSIRETILARRFFTGSTSATSSWLEGVTDVTLRAGETTVEIALPSDSEALGALTRLHASR